jgi:hypothetical protein
LLVDRRMIITRSVNELPRRARRRAPSTVTLWPITRREQLGLGTCGRWNDLLATPESRWRELLADGNPPAEDWRRLASRGGFPTPHARGEPATRTARQPDRTRQGCRTAAACFSTARIWLSVNLDRVMQNVLQRENSTSQSLT